MKKLILLISLAVAIYFIAESRTQRVFQIPNGTKNSCLNCHFSMQGGSLNKFGEDVGETMNGGGAGGEVNWLAVYNLDSDGDGFTNGEELLDPNGEWSQGDAQPGDPSLVTLPGNANSFPSSVEEDITDFELLIGDGQIQLTSSNLLDLNMEVSIVNTAGEIILSNRFKYGQRYASIDLSLLSSGNYFVIINRNGKLITRAFSYN